MLQPHEHPVPEAATGRGVRVEQVPAKPLVCAGKLDQCSSGEMSWPPRRERANMEFIGSPSSTSLLLRVNEGTFGSKS
jgi:hypothetical protein